MFGVDFESAALDDDDDDDGLSAKVTVFDSERCDDDSVDFCETEPSDTVDFVFTFSFASFRS